MSLKCLDSQCKEGVIDFNTTVYLGTGDAFPCSACGRLHYLMGDEVHKILVPVNKQGKAAYWNEGAVWLDKPIINPCDCDVHSSIEHMQSVTGECPKCGC